MAKRVLRGVELMWCNFTTKDDYGKYSCKVLLNDESAALVESWGLTYKTDDEGRKYMQLRRDKDGQGEELPAPKVVDGDLNEITGVLVGNGSIGNVQLDVYQYQRYGGGTACRLVAVQITNLIVYGDDEELAPVSGDEELTSGAEGTIADNPF